MNNLRAAVKLVTFLLLTVILIIPQCFCILFKLKNIHFIPVLYHSLLCSLLGISVQVNGQKNDAAGTIYVSNHLSYLDIIVLSTQLKASFIAKADVEKWPLFGILAKLSRTIFIQRTKVGIKSGSTAIKQRLQSGDRLILFPEGTSNNGREVLPFKSGFFEVLLQSEKCVHIQPLTLQLVSINEVNAHTQEDFDHYAWYGDMTLVPHLWAFFKLKSCDISITFHDPVEITNDITRKELAKKCEEAVSIPFKTLYDLAD